MSTHADHDHDAAAHSLHPGQDHSHHGSLKDYLTGFSLAAVLTAIPFWIVIGDVFRSPIVAAVVILLFAAVQIVVHMVYFLHMNTRSEGGWTFLALMFTAVLVVITLSGSLRVMQHLDSNMMPMSPAQMRSMP